MTSLYGKLLPLAIADTRPIKAIKHVMTDSRDTGGYEYSVDGTNYSKIVLYDECLTRQGAILLYFAIYDHNDEIVMRIPASDFCIIYK